MSSTKYFFVTLDLYVYEEGKSRIFLQNLHFSANSIKMCYFFRFFIIFWLFTNLALKKHRTQGKKVLCGGLNFFIWYMYVLTHKKNTAAIFDWLRASTDFLIGVVLFPLFSGYSLILCKKNSGGQKTSYFKVDSFFQIWYMYVLSKKKWPQPSVTDIKCVRVFFTNMVLFSEFSLEGPKFEK